MATILRYVRYLRQTGSLTRRLNINHNHLESNVGGLRLQNHRVTTLTKNLSTRPVIQHAKPTYTFEKKFHELEMQLRRSGRTNRTDIERILGDIQLAGSVPSLDALLLIRSCGRPLIDQNSKESVQLVQEIWDTLERLRIPMDVSHYNALLSVYLEKDYDFSQAEFLQKMMEKNIEPNRVTYHRLIEAYCRKGDIQNATKVLEKMQQKGLPLCENVFNSLITGHACANDMKNAEAVLDTMKAAGIEPSIDTYNALLCAYARHGDMDSINKTMEKMAAQDFSLLDEHMSEIIETLVANGHIEKAEEFSYKLPKDIKSDTEVGRLLVKLLDMKQPKLALTILSNTTTDPTRNYMRSGFIIKTAATNKIYTPEEVIELCTKIEDEGFHTKTWSFALFHSLSKGTDPKLSFALMNAWQKKGGEIRQHFFWPMLRQEVRANNYQGILDTLKTMVDEFKIAPSIETLRDYVIPFMFGTWDSIIAQLVPLQVPKETVLQAIAERSIRDRKLRNAVLFMASYPVNYPKDKFLEAMVNSLNMQDDAKSFVSLLRFLGDEPGECDPNDVPVKIVDDAVLALISSLPTYRPNVLEKVLMELNESGLSMSPEVGEKVKEFLGQAKAHEHAELISRLTSGELKPLPLEEYNPQVNNMNTEYVKKPPGLNIPQLRTQFAFHLEKSDGQELLKILKQLLSVDYPSPAPLAQALDLFSTTGNIEAAEYCYSEFKSRFEGADLDTTKLLGYATLLVKKDRLPDAIKLIADTPELNETQKLSRGVKVKTRELLDAVADTKNVENTQEMFELLKSKDYLIYDNYSLGPLIRVHLARNDIDKAMEAFEKFYNDYKCTPYKNVLANALIKAEDANNLQKMTDFCTELHGESNALVDLAFLFLEAGRTHQARKILETTGIQVFNEKLTNAIKHFDALERQDCLAELTKITRGVVRVDWTHLFNTLLEAYSAKNNWQRGLALWTEMQEMDLTPTNFFLNTLKNLLEKNNQPVPFITDESNKANIERKKNVSRERRRGETPVVIPQEFREALENNDWDGAEDLIKANRRDKREMRVLYAELMRAAAENGDLEKAAQLVKSVVHEFGTIPKRAFKTVAQALADAGKHSLLEDLGTYLSEGLKVELDYYKILSSLQMQKMGIRDYIEQLAIEAPSENPQWSGRKINFGAMVDELLKDPSYLEEFEKWAYNSSTRLDRGLHVLWNYHFIKDGPKSEELWDNCMIQSSTPLVRPIITFAIENKDPVLLKKLIAKLDTHPRLDVSTKCKVISGLIDVYNSMENYDEGIKILQDVSKSYRLSMFRHSALQELKEGLERNGKAFPFTLEPLKVRHPKIGQMENLREKAAGV